MLEGKELIAFIKAHPELGKTELARAAGYTRTAEDGKEQILIAAFYDASMAAHGTPIKSRGVSNGKRPQYQTTVHASGILLVGKNYTKEFDAKPGDVFGIEIKDDGIWLPLLEESPGVAAATPVARTAPVAPEPELEDEDEDDLAAFDGDDGEV